MEWASTLALKLFDDAGHPRMLGWATFVMALGSIVYMQASGRTAVINAAYPYLVHGIIIIPLILIMVFLKEPETEKISSSESSEIKSTEKLPGATIFSSLMFAVIFFAFYPVLLNISAIVDHDKLGGAVMAGTISSLFTIGNAIAGLIFVRVHKAAGRYTIAAGLIAWVAGMLIFSFGESIVMLGAGMFLCGVAFQIVWPGTINSFSEYAPQNKLAFASAIFSSGMNIGCFLTTFFISAVADLSGNNDPRLPCVYGLVIVIICAAVWSFGEARRKKS